MESFKARIYSINNLNIHTLRSNSQKTPLILLHGLMLSGACWIPTARELEKDYEVILPDSRGHGHSSALDHGYSYENLARDVSKLITTLKLKNPIVLGHSMGGMTAAVLASQNPNLLKALILVDPPFLTTKQQKEIDKGKILAEHRHILSQSKENYLAQLKARHEDRRSCELLELFAEARFQTSDYAFDILSPFHFDKEQFIKNLSVPCLLITGGPQAVISSLTAKKLAFLNPYLKVKQIAKATHAIPFDQPESFLILVKDFLKSLFNKKLP